MSLPERDFQEMCLPEKDFQQMCLPERDFQEMYLPERDPCLKRSGEPNASWLLLELPGASWVEVGAKKSTFCHTRSLM